MKPGLEPGAVIVAWGKPARVGDVVVARQASREVVKRIEKIDGNKVYLRGDNQLESVDSGEFGPVKKDDILGVVMLKLAVAVSPPKPRQPYGPLIGWVAAGTSSSV
jgi:SOS-response transcriptional repressor LexA